MSHSICVILTENVREKEVPAVTTVSTTGLLLERPMSTYTAHTRRYTTVRCYWTIGNPGGKLLALASRMVRGDTRRTESLCALHLLLLWLTW